MSDSLDVVALVAALAWPVVLLILLVIYRAHLVALLEKGSGRITKLSVAGVSIELAKGTEAAIPWTAPAVDLRQAGQSANINDSTARTFLEQFKETQVADYVTVDLGRGREWLTSRLFIVAILLERMRSLQYFVFLEERSETRRRYLGIAEPSEVRWCLAQTHGWLEKAFRDCYQAMADFEVTNADGRMGLPHTPADPWPALDLLQRFLGNVQQPGVSTDDYVLVDEAAGIVEHAHWLDGASVERLLGNHLNRSYVRSVDLAGRTTAEQISIILSQPGPYVALTLEDRSFERLVDRRQILETATKSLLGS